jgi:hypothetical protein
MKTSATKKGLRPVGKTRRLGKSPLGEKPEEKLPEQKPAEKEPQSVPFNVVVSGTTSLYIPPTYHHEKILRLHVAAILDVVEEVDRHRKMVHWQTQIVTWHASKTRSLCALGVFHAASLGARETLEADYPYETLKLARTNLAEGIANLRDQVKYFRDAYDNAAKEISEPVVQGILAALHRGYLDGPARFAPTWKTFLELLENEKIAITFPH